MDRYAKQAIICNVVTSNTTSTTTLKILPTIKTYENSTAYGANYSRNTSYLLQRNSFGNLSQFITYVKQKVMSRKIIHQPPGRFLTTVFHFPPYPDMVLPYCDGLWMEFGVFDGRSLNHVTRWKSLYCGNNSGLVYGFDTFTGLPTDWRPGFPKGKFAINSDQLRIEPNVALVKGLFIDSLPQELLKHKNIPVSYVHIDCDIYEGARDVLFLLASRFVRRTLLMFDELFNYSQHEKHEIKALFEFLVASHNLELETLGSAYPIAFDDTEENGESQSTGFVVV
ncbi:unnamed protein product [Rotaria sp. Silwood2]|nr:unnamed protein product [Rotaria sp. Silwood2]CAF3162039.1 unnamed protein product [Rotaria sp. Silwood2]CAF4482896.1 unnamed protein product [Rotaria sp. Silwood2]